MLLKGYKLCYKTNKFLGSNVQHGVMAKNSVSYNWKLLTDLFSNFFFPIIFISWRLITLQYCSGFCHTLTWISHGFTYVPHPELPSHLPPHPSLWVIPVHQPRALVSCIQHGLAICFTLDNIHVSMLFSQIIPPLPSPRVQKPVLYTCVSFSVLHIGLSLPSF